MASHDRAIYQEIGLVERKEISLVERIVELVNTVQHKHIHMQFNKMFLLSQNSKLATCNGVMHFL